MRKVIRRLRRAFTLVELLVVIFIAGVLVVLLIDMQPKPHRTSGIADCTNNLHQIGLALNMYSQMYGEFYPYCNSPNATDSLALLYPDLLPTAKVFRCRSTSDSPAITVTLDGNGNPISKQFGLAPLRSSYGYDRTIAYRNVNPMMPIAGDMDGTSATNPKTLTANHLGGQNVLFYDGHVKWMQANTWVNNDGLTDNFYLADLAPAYEPDPAEGTITHYGDTDAYIQRP